MGTLVLHHGGLRLGYRRGTTNLILGLKVGREQLDESERNMVREEPSVITGKP